MRILIVHTAYTQKGGEDAVLASESELLKREHEVSTLLFNNSELKTESALRVIPKTLYNRAAEKKLSEHIDSFKPDIIHVHNLFYVASPSILYAAKRKKIPLVMTLHNFRLICSGALLLRDNQVCERCVQQTFPLSGIRHACFQNSSIKTAQLTATVGIHKLLGTWNKLVDRYIVFSPFLKERFLDSSLNLKESQIAIKPNFVEDFGFSPMANRGNSYLFIGRLSSEKGIETAINAAIKGEFTLEIIGGGDLEGMVKEAASKSSHVVFHGFQNRDFILDKLRKAKALIFPSIWYEGMPITILESLSTGTPILISDQKNVGDFIREGIDGLHFKASNEADLIEKVRDFDLQQKDSFYTAARENYEKNYTPEGNLSQLTQLYKELIERPRQ